MTEPTSKDLLRQISQDQKTNAKQFFEYAQTMSNFMNKQSELNSKWDNYLESNKATNQEGAVEKLDRVDKNLTSLEQRINVKIAYFTGGFAVAMTIGKWVIAKTLT